MPPFMPLLIAAIAPERAAQIGSAVCAAASLFAAAITMRQQKRKQACKDVPAEA